MGVPNLPRGSLFFTGRLGTRGPQSHGVPKILTPAPDTVLAVRSSMASDGTSAGNDMDRDSVSLLPGAESLAPVMVRLASPGTASLA